MSSDTHEAQRSSALPGLALALGLLWLLTGSLYKLFEGNVADLPPSVLEKSPFDDPWDTFRYAIAIELAVVGLTIALPRLGWLFLAGTFGTFLAVLFPLWQSGAESCGCFGGTVTIKPLHMMLIDGGLLLFILFSRPWRLPRGAGLGSLAALALMGAGVAAPLMKLQAIDTNSGPARSAEEIRADALAQAQANRTSEIGETVEGLANQAVDTAQAATEAAEEAVTEDPESPATVEGGDEEVASEPTDAEETGLEPVDIVDTVGTVGTVDSGLPPFMNLPIDTWVGQDIWTLPFVSAPGVVDFSEGAFEPNAHVVVYRQTCEVCKEHLETLALELQSDPMKLGGRPIVLMRIAEKIDETQENLCRTLPEGAQKVTLAALEKGYLVTTPMAFDLDDAMVVREVTNVREEMGH